MDLQGWVFDMESVVESFKQSNLSWDADMAPYVRLADLIYESLDALDCSSPLVISAIRSFPESSYLLPSDGMDVAQAGNLPLECSLYQQQHRCEQVIL